MLPVVSYSLIMYKLSVENKIGEFRRTHMWHVFGSEQVNSYKVRFS